MDPELKAEKVVEDVQGWRLHNAQEPKRIQIASRVTLSSKLASDQRCCMCRTHESALNDV